MVGAVRFELTTSCTRNKRATRLRYAPTLVMENCRYALFFPEVFKIFEFNEASVTGLRGIFS